jgi:hypothetical protein
LEEDKMSHLPYEDERFKEEVHNLLRYDGLTEAERVTGKSYKEDAATEAMGVMSFIANNKARAAVLEMADDSTYSSKVESYTRILTEEGFARIFHENFEYESYGEIMKEFCEAWWSPEGFLLYFDTYRGEKVNSANVYYNWLPNEGIERWNFTSSGGFSRCVIDGQEIMVWCGGHDAREALRFNLHGLRSNGKLLPTWAKRPHLWLINHGQTKVAPEGYKESGPYYRSIREAVIGQFPEEIRAAVSPSSEVSS